MTTHRPLVQPPRPKPHGVHRPVAVVAPVMSAVLLLAAVDACADAQPYYVGVNETVSHDSNIFRLGDAGQNTSETSYRTSLVGGIDQPLGRQQLHADAHVSDTRYSHNTDLNNVSYGLASLLNWETAYRISGVFGANINRGLADFADTSLVPQQQVRVRNISTTQAYLARFSKGMAARWSWDGGLTHRSQRYSAPEFSASALDLDGGDFGLSYHQSDLLSLGVSVGYSRGRYPNFVSTAGGPVTPDVFTRRDITLHGRYEISGLTAFTGRIGYTTQENTLAQQLNVSGITGSAALRYAPGGRFAYNAEVTRDAGTSLFSNNGANSFAPPPLIATPTPAPSSGTPTTPTVGNSFGTDNSRITTTGRIGVSYAVSALVAANASYSHVTRSLAGATTRNDGAGSDATNNFSFSMTYIPKRYLSFGCGVFFSSRSSSSTLSSTYSDRTESCSAQLTLR